ncbi:MAG TPA: hypothetical protein VF760_00275, partial [Xanthobacteraceae bacterium]
MIALMLRSRRRSGALIERTMKAVTASASASAISPPVMAASTARRALRIEASRRASDCCSMRLTICSISLLTLRMRDWACAISALPPAL